MWICASLCIFVCLCARVGVIYCVCGCVCACECCSVYSNMFVFCAWVCSCKLSDSYIYNALFVNKEDNSNPWLLEISSVLWWRGNLKFIRLGLGVAGVTGDAGWEGEHKLDSSSQAGLIYSSLWDLKGYFRSAMQRFGWAHHVRKHTYPLHRHIKDGCGNALIIWFLMTRVGVGVKVGPRYIVSNDFIGSVTSFCSCWIQNIYKQIFCKWCVDLKRVLSRV